MFCVTALSAYMFLGWQFLSTAFFGVSLLKKEKKKSYERGPPSTHPPKQLGAA